MDSLYARLFWPHTLPIQFKASIIWQNVMAIFSIEFYSFARFSQIPAAGAGGDGAGGCGLVTGSLWCLIERESYPAV